ncbi:TSUP family transporter [Epibacterium sp. SM1979]|uniref:Probable membrane transporter protein n=1 Tax=Tritonibacter litoralis TaxID=2662264 RepID=A0A843YBK9_9RHOB|nr:sulfite exporter TauE/SafE family protein [Tritonibacter litoralis]MQQ08680.1 TSUP family transporter [Tritonibacter litoralis]
MDTLISLISPTQMVVAFVVALAAGTVKGMVGFALPMILISGLSSVLSPDLALAGLIFPTLVTNGMQALRQGRAAAVESVKRFKVFLLVGLVFLLASAQLVRVLPQSVMLLIIGVPVMGFALMQIAGRNIVLHSANRRVEASVAAVAGLIGGVSGVWGPPTVAYLTALGTEKTEQMRVQGVIYGLGAIALLFAHIGSGVVRAETAPFSVAMVVPAVIGMWIGGKLQDRIDQSAFKKATLWVLLIASANLIRRAVMGF